MPAALLLVLGLWFVSACDDGGGSAPALRFLGVADDAGCERLRIEIDREEAGAASGQAASAEAVSCTLTATAQAAGCTLTHQRAEMDVIVAIIEGCDVGGDALLACSFAGEAPAASALEQATTTVCACPCDESCEAAPSVCAGETLDLLCPSAQATTVTAGARAAQDSRGTASGVDPPTRCEVVFSVTSGEEIGALQVEVNSTDPGVQFRGTGPSVECVGLAQGGITSFNELGQSLYYGVISLNGIQGPADLFQCMVEGTGSRDADDFDVFVIEVVDATDPSLRPISPTVEHTGTRDCHPLTPPTTIGCDVAACSSTTSSSTLTTLCPDCTTTTTIPCVDCPSTSSTVTSTSTPTSSTTNTSSTTSTVPAAATLRISVSSEAALSAATVDARVSNTNLTSCEVLIGASAVSHDQDDLSACLYFDSPLAAGTHAVIECSLSNVDGAEVSAGIVRALNERLETVEDAEVDVQIFD
ncbi:MAG TPA: hypothetical protein VEC57_01955 [Candidatus Limnocylindrales bacterium]|nr:hypothetical protein [Candidatus Limnocylindrales bacterium]